MAPAVLVHPGAVASTCIGGTGVAKASEGRKRAPERIWALARATSPSCGTNAHAASTRRSS
jgi:hypothetical protein